jgi:hypothetical protein
MRIVKNIEEPTTRFDDLTIGDVFLDRDENVCMKVPMVHNEFSGEEIENLLEGCMSAEDFYEHEVNAYDLENHEFFWIDDDTQVRPLNAYLEVK